MKKKIFALTLALVLALSLAACGGKKTTTLKVAASPTPHAEILAQCVDVLKEQGIEPRVFRSGNCPGTDEYNARILADFMPRVRHL